MKNILLLFTLLVPCALFAQDDSDKKKKESANEPRDRIVLNFSFDNWIFDKKLIDSLETKWNSFGFGLFYMYDIPLGKSRFSLAPGLGFRASWVKNNSTLNDGNDSIGTFFQPISGYKRNSLVASYFDIPIELRYRSKPNSKNKSFKLAAGCVGGVQMNNHTSTKAEMNGDMRITRVHRWDNLTRFHFGPTFRIGFGAVNLFAYYSVTNFFRKDKGPEIHPFSAGFSINAL